METTLLERNRLGLDDFILLEDYTNIDAFVNNLKIRFEDDIIYTNIGKILISVNPYKELPIYSQEILENYKNSSNRALPPHIYALADAAYRFQVSERVSQCMLISGESGSGKTEASKKVLQYIADVSPYQNEMREVKDKLLHCNPILEAFGNAKTNKNDNSSRFGKYMSVNIDYTGKPVGGEITNYLMEKSRVIQRNPGDRNFHIFYQLLAGAENDFLDALHLNRDIRAYNYLKQPVANPIPSENEAEQFLMVQEAMSIIGISDAEKREIFDIIAAVLHLGNIFFEDVDDVSRIRNTEPATYVCELLGCSKKNLVTALTRRTLEAADEVFNTPLNKEQSIHARDALAKAIYTRLFDWLVSRLNKSLCHTKSSETSAVFAILDIYGFEVFEKNSYEQFCINYCNEKLQQLFTELTLKEEQREYLGEEIKWVPIHYFNNLVICELIEERHKGIIDMLNEECLRPGITSDLSFLEKMNTNLATHKHYISHMKSDTKTQKTMEREEFRLLHYAGEVIYNVNGFLEKNSDLLFRDLIDLMADTTNSIMMEVFRKEQNNKKRPDTAINYFKNSLNKLIETLKNKECSYIRCIKPNNFQLCDTFDFELVKHQVKYLGLMENLLVRRSGFAYRKEYNAFLQRYKCLSKHTWPHYFGHPKEGVRVLLNDLGLDKKDYALGKTKVFLKTSTTLFAIEDKYQLKKHDIADIIKKNWKGAKERRKYRQIRERIILIQKMVRGFIVRRRVERIRNAIRIIVRFIEGFITRHGPETDINRRFIQFIKARWLINLSRNLPKNVLDKSWPPCPAVCEEASAILRDLRMKQLALRYRSGITPEMKKKFQEKVLAEFLFKGRKKLYASTIPEWFEKDRLTNEQRQMVPAFQNKLLPDEKVLYSTRVTKYDRHGYKTRNRALFFTNKNIYLVDGKTFKLKHKILYKDINELTVTTEGDNFLLVRISKELKKDKGDIILSMPNLVETVTMFIDFTQKPKLLKVTNESSILHYLINEKPRTIKVVAGSTGSIPDICKNKSGQLVIMG